MRKLTLRERVLLILLAIIVVISAYVMLFSMPLDQKSQTLTEEIALADELALQLELRLGEKQRMERELQQLETAEDAPAVMPEYDNLQAVMMELHRILANCDEYSLSFLGDETENQVYCRQVVLPFTCGSYEEARNVVQQLRDSDLRCMIDSVEIQEEENGGVSAMVTVTFLEYRPEQTVAADGEDAA